ncbi:MAG: tetratricopeptide repeat-containing sensor histidine kinase [Candidatus Cloacimonetes bacterium]|nr:tetratricopeptide repeat-containing sensor histidine kinase [Candidatus Cloacimonadota bacterium]MDY0338105.1 tetratricopeptide repeat-containing sensor histidine kinase [Candidatus Cloacimonadaceae bacterium]MCB5268645.1 tetratricopeptide repeat-containing sensor histidine kinase [Candidatus Cloacimonadota bacterium]MCK9334888.1 tetratricopeptide repeat-containing sensor histidine kinase [Candidatus Cloacimonadota bacterium]MDD2544002.1 tetratricopeptide repeat-containing sensor histidine k
MKKEFTKAVKTKVFAQIEDIIRLERTAALEVIDEILELLDTVDLSKNPEDEISILIGLARYYVNSRDTNSAEAVLQRALNVAESNELQGEVLHVKSTYAIIHSMRGDHLKAIYIWEDMLTQIDKTQTTWMALVNNLVVAYGFTMQFTRAVDLCYELLQELDAGEDEPDVRISILINLGNAYGPLKSHEKALKAYQEAYELAEREQNIPYLSYVLSNMAGTLSDLQRYDEAYEAAQKALEINQKYYGDEQVADALCLLGSSCTKLERYDEAKSYLMQALPMRQPETDLVGHISTLINLATLHLKQEEYAEALKYLEQAHPLAKDTEIVRHRINLYSLWSEYYEKIQDYQKANECLRVLAELHEQQYTELSAKLISKQEAEYLRHKIELQNQSLIKTNQELEDSNQLIKRQAQQLEEGNRELHASLGMLNRLISIISHDVRGPAANSAAALRMIHDGSLGQEVSQKLIGQVIDSLDGVMDLLTEIMLWIESRSFNKSVDRLMHNVDIMSLLDPVLKLYQSHLSQKKINLDLHCGEGDRTCYTEPNIMKIVLRNILSNATKFTPEGGKIYISFLPKKDHLKLCIRDTGVGMSKEEITMLLKQGLKSKTGTNQEPGMGMGLRYSLGYLKLLGVEFNISSEEGQGTEFTLKLRPAKRD